METLFAKALFDNTAESEGELAFSKGDIMAVLERSVVGGTGWWKCSLHGRQGLAPANRLVLLSPAQAEELGANSRDFPDYQNIYQTPKPFTALSADPIYEEINMIRRLPLPHIHSTNKHTSHNDADGTGFPPDASTAQARTGAELYDVPRRTAFFTVCSVSSLATQRPSFDIPLPSISEDSQKPLFVYRTIPKPPAKSMKPKPPNSEWIYDVPVCMQKQGGKSGHHGTLPLKTMNSNEQLYDVLPTRVRLQGKDTVTKPISDVPKLSCAAQETETSSNSILPRQHGSPKNDSERKSEPIKYRGKPRPMRDQLHRWPSKAPSLSRQPVEDAIGGDDKDNKDNQRSSTVSTFSTASSSPRSSCDSLLSSPEPEPLCEVSLSQEEAVHRLCELQEGVCQSVSKLMLFVNSQWRSKDHLGQHLPQIRTATEEVTDSITSFLSFALDVRSKVQRLTDLNVQRRLLKQLSIVEEADFVLQQAADALQDLGWALKTLAQDAGQSQTPDHLEKFVMVARTVPEDVKTLVFILNANGKLLFKGSSQEADKGPSEKRSLRNTESTVDSGIDDSDCAQLQVSESESRGSCTPVQPFSKPSVSDYCRLYFGDIQKAISMFVSSLNYGQPPEKFIFHSKQVIMMGQRLVNTLCNEAKKRESSLEMLFVINQLCVHLKHLAMATKKAALNFPDELALQEAQDVARELEIRAQHFSMRLEVWMFSSQGDRQVGGM